MSGHVWTVQRLLGIQLGQQILHNLQGLAQGCLHPKRRENTGKVKSSESSESSVSFASLTSFQGHGLLSFSLWTKACRLAVPLVELLVSESLLQRRIGEWYDIGETAMKSCASRCGCYMTFRAKSQKVWTLGGRLVDDKEKTHGF